MNLGPGTSPGRVQSFSIGSLQFGHFLGQIARIFRKILANQSRCISLLIFAGLATMIGDDVSRHTRRDFTSSSKYAASFGIAAEMG